MHLHLGSGCYYCNTTSFLVYNIIVTECVRGSLKIEKEASLWKAKIKQKLCITDCNIYNCIQEPT